MVHISVIRGFPIISILTNNQTHLTLTLVVVILKLINWGEGGGGGGGGGGWGTWVFRGAHTLVIKIKNTPKALISGQKSTLILIKH